MPSDAFLQIRTALDSTTEITGGDSRTGVGAVFILDSIVLFRELTPATPKPRAAMTKKTMTTGL